MNNFDANKKQRDFLSGLGFKYNKVTISEVPYVTTFRFELTEQLKQALNFYYDFTQTQQIMGDKNEQTENSKTISS